MGVVADAGFIWADLGHGFKSPPFGRPDQQTIAVRLMNQKGWCLSVGWVGERYQGLSLVAETPLVLAPFVGARRLREAGAAR